MAKPSAEEARKAARKELDRWRLKLLTAGGYASQAVEAHARSWFSLARAFVDGQSSGSDLVKDSVTASIQCLKDDQKAAVGICHTFCKEGGEHQPKPKMESGVIVFPLDQYTQATDPFPIGVPLPSGGPGVVVTVSPGGQIPPGNISISEASDGETMEVALVHLGVSGARLFPNEGTYTATLIWAGGSQVIEAVVTFI